MQWLRRHGEANETIRQKVAADGFASVAAYCHAMGGDRAWAGEPELEALARDRQWRVVVLQDGQAPKTYGEEDWPQKVLVYNGINHYDAAVQGASANHGDDGKEH